MPASSLKSKTLRLGLVGCGRIAQSHLQAISETPNVKLTAVVDVRESVGVPVAEQYKCRLFSQYEAVELRDCMDAVIICTPPNTHFEITKYFLSHNVHVLCEKPITFTPEEGNALLSLSQKNNLVWMMASKFRYVDDVRKAKSIVEAGILGEIVLYENVFCSKVNMANRWNSSKEISGGGVLIDNGSHSVDIARYLLGPIKEVQAQMGILIQQIDVEDTVRLQFRTEKACMGTIDLSWSINKESDAYISLFGSEGTLHIGWSHSRYRQEGNSNWVKFGSGYNKASAFHKQLENFIGTIQGIELPLMTPDDAIASVCVIESAYASAKKNAWMRIKV